MKEVNPEPLDGIVEVDETFVGGVQRGEHWKRSENNKKEIVVGIKQRGGELRFFHAECEVWNAGEIHQRKRERRR
jgi:ISXO2-like transposase domain